MKQRYNKYIIFILIVFICSLANGIFSEAAQTGWIKNGSTYRYQVKGTYVKNKVKKIKNKYYYFDKQGICKTGWKKYKGNKYYFDKKKRHAYTGLKKVGKNLYIFKKNGRLVCKKGLYTYQGRSYYINKNGKLAVGWKEINGEKRYFNESYGYMETGETEIGKDTYLFDADGKPQYGLIKKGEYTLFCNQYGKILKNTLIKYKGKRYYSDTRGHLVKGLYTISGHKYYFENSYAMSTGFINLDKNILYFEKNGQLVANKWITINGKQYYADRYGYLKRNCWYNNKYFNNKGEIVPDAVKISDDDKGFITSEMLDALDIDNSDKLMIVAHPDDETLWGGAHLAEGGYLVVCLTNANNAKRKQEFERVMEASGNKGIILSYPDTVGGVRSTWSKEKNKIAKDIDTLLKYKEWKMVITHNPQGEYGHIHHKYTNAIVTQVYYLNYKRDDLYYFGKHYNAKTLPEVADKLKKVSENNLKAKYQYLKFYESQATCVSQHIHLAPYENWCRSVDWK